VANEKLHRSAQAATRNKLSSYGLDEIRYWIYASREKFDVHKFIAALGEKSDQSYYECAFVPHDPAIGYNVSIAMWPGDQEITLQLVYSTEISSRRRKKKVKDSGPPVEELGDWLAQFFKYENTEGHIHGHFSYPLESRVSKFPLPLKTSIEDAEIDGVSLRLPTQPEGVMRVRVTQGDKEWYVEVVADRRITLKGFTPHLDVKALASVVNTLLEERKS
jgi:hypothetical protein